MWRTPISSSLTRRVVVVSIYHIVVFFKTIFAYQRDGIHDYVVRILIITTLIQCMDETELGLKKYPGLQWDWNIDRHIANY